MHNASGRVPPIHPLPYVAADDVFDSGFNGWMDLTPNFVYEDFAQQPGAVDLGQWGPIMLSNGATRLGASNGSLSGTYSLKMATTSPANRYEARPAPGSMSVAIKRLSVPFPGTQFAQIDSWFTYSASQESEGTGESSVRAFGCFFDLQDDECRWQPGVRYVNSVNGRPVKKWQYFHVNPGVSKADWCFGKRDGWEEVGIDGIWSGRRYQDGSADAFAWVPAGNQELIYNESPDKLNWMNLSLTVDLVNHEYVDFSVMGRRFDVQGLPGTKARTYKGISGLVNPVFFVENDDSRNAFLYLDNVAISFR